jgi:hypothetical protein
MCFGGKFFFASTSHLSLFFAFPLSSFFFLCLAMCVRVALCVVSLVESNRPCIYKYLFLHSIVIFSLSLPPSFFPFVLNLQVCPVEPNQRFPHTTTPVQRTFTPTP